jgi:hypothetical protein
MLPIVLRGIDKNTAIPVTVNAIWPLGPQPEAGMFVTFTHRHELYEGQIIAVDVDTRGGVETPYSLRLEAIRRKDRYPR